MEFLISRIEEGKSKEKQLEDINEKINNLKKHNDKFETITYDMRDFFDSFKRRKDEN